MATFDFFLQPCTNVCHADNSAYQTGVEEGIFLHTQNGSLYEGMKNLLYITSYTKAMQVPFGLV